MKNSLYQELFIENKQLFRIMKIIVYVCFLCVGNLLAIGSSCYDCFQPYNNRTSD